ncbi:neuromedin-U receptor 2-like [Acanthaster planci]|uniref:Neuromedin-U receptor 2-like n=1 Tax=Acanthaster planci TaxID=133434 RepID=A0A8B7ZQ53_ACAPL|nr:neuromedin-U receptor 2-like [Acanthaster planci]
MVAAGLTGVFGNLLVCFVILRVKFLHTITNVLLVNLAVADMLQAYNLCLVTFEKYVAILHPLHYARRLTATRMKILTALIWVTSFISAVPFLFVHEPSDLPRKACTANHYQSKILPPVQVFSTLFGYALPITVMSVAYYKMQVTLKRQAKALNLQHARAAAYDLVIARQRLVNMLLIVLGALIILWTPAYVVYNLCPDGKDQALPSLCSSKGYELVENICKFLYYMNSVINPVIYGFKYKKFRQGLKVACCSCFSEHGNQNRVNNEIFPQ